MVTWLLILVTVALVASMVGLGLSLMTAEFDDSDADGEL